MLTQASLHKASGPFPSPPPHLPGWNHPLTGVMVSLDALGGAAGSRNPVPAPPTAQCAYRRPNTLSLKCLRRDVAPHQIGRSALCARPMLRTADTPRLRSDFNRSFPIKTILNINFYSSVHRIAGSEGIIARIAWPVVLRLLFGPAMRYVG